MASFTHGSQRFNETEWLKQLKRSKSHRIKAQKTKHDGNLESSGQRELHQALIGIEDIHEEQWQKDLNSLIFTKKKITLERMSQIVLHLNEASHVEILSFEGCDFEKNWCQPLKEVSASCEIDFLDLMGCSITEKYDWGAIGMFVNKYRVKGLRLCECRINSWTFGYFCSGMVECPVASNVTTVSSEIIDLRGNEIVFDDYTYSSLDYLVSSRRFRMFCFDGFTLKINQDQKVILDMKPDIQGIDSSVWGKMVPLYQVHGISLSSSHDLARDPTVFAQILRNSDYTQLKELSVQVEGTVSHYKRAVNLVIMLNIEDFIVSDQSDSLRTSCVKLLLENLVEHGHQLRSFGIFFENDISKKCASVIGDIVFHSKVKRFLVSYDVTAIDSLASALNKLSVEKHYKVEQIITRLVSPGEYFSDASLDEAIPDDVLDMEDVNIDRLLTLARVAAEAVVFEMLKKWASHMLPLLRKSFEGIKNFEVKQVDVGISIFVKNQTVSRTKPADFGWLHSTINDMEANFANVTRMDLSGKVLDEKYIHSFGGILRFCLTLEKLLVAKCQLKDQDVSNITDSLSMHKNKMFLLDLSNNPELGKKSAQSLSDFLQRRHIKNIKVIGCGLEKWHEEIITPGMLNMPRDAGTTITYEEDQVIVLVDKQGVNIDFSTKNCSVTIPPNAVQKPIELTFKLTHPGRFDNIPDWSYPVTSILRCLPNGAKFSEYIEVKLHTWIKQRKAQSDQKLNLHLLTREDNHKKWDPEATIQHDDDDFIEFQINHFCDFEVVINSADANNVQANYCNMLFKLSVDPLTTNDHLLLSKFVPNNNAAKEQQKRELEASGMCLYALGLNELTIMPEDQISVLLMSHNEADPAQVQIRHSEPLTYTGAEIFSQTSPKVKFTARLTNRANPQNEQIKDLYHEVTGANGGNFKDPITLRWRPELEVPERPQYIHKNIYNINGCNVNISQGNTVVTTSATVGPEVVDEAALDDDIQEAQPPLQADEKPVILESENESSSDDSSSDSWLE
uniref:uncharacterized protein LOC120342567 n=1 Tax=Styela clava TaxID=7725 RepID=UPI00193A3BC9|nr:uncharacterized protein LOC120342567 [Styela clava]